MVLRFRSLIHCILLVLSITGYGQHYRVGLCPGPSKDYQILAEQVYKLPVSGNVKWDEEKLKEYLNCWTLKANEAGLKRFRVEIRYPDKQVRFWQSDTGNKPNFFNASTSAAAGRGGLNTVAKPGDNQRCFFQDTTIVLDTLHMRLGDFSPNTQFDLVIDQKHYLLPLNEKRSELLIHAGLLPANSTGHYLSATAAIDGVSQSVVFYFLSPDDRSQLVQSLRASMAEEPEPCRNLPDRLVAYMIQNWGGKQCTDPALYLSSQRQVIKNLLRTERIICTP